MKSMKCQFLKYWLILSIYLSFQHSLISQSYFSSPSVWLFPEGNSEATKYQAVKSSPQDFSKFVIKWRNNSISGDGVVLIGNIINDGKLDDSFPFAPIEIVSLIGGKVVVIDSKGKTHQLSTQGVPFAKNLSFLFDTLSNSYAPLPNSTLIAGIETIEFENQKDTLLYTFIAGYDSKADTMKLINKMVIDLRAYKPNIYGSLKTFFGQSYGSEYHLYAISNIFYPQVNDPNPSVAPFFRGITLFQSNNVVYNFPLPYISDNPNFRTTLGPDVSFCQPSITNERGTHFVLLPTFPTPFLDVQIPNRISLQKTNASKNYLLGFQIGNNQIRQLFPFLDLSSYLQSNGSRAQIRPYFVRLNNSTSGDDLYILVAEEYRGLDSSFGTSKLHLFSKTGSPITFDSDPIAPSFVGKDNHIWSIAVGNVDGNPTNEWLPYYPNNLGNEIIATYSSPNSTVPDNKLIILRFNESSPIPKPNLPGTYLFPFDTICTFRISGWVSAVNDLDGATDGKDEIVLVDGKKLLVLRLKDYNTFDFKAGRYFDTVLYKEFPNETIFRALVSDVDGDGLNDILVITNNYTYLIGSPLPKMIEITEPKTQGDLPIDFCLGDTLVINLKSKTKTDFQVNVRFVPFNNGNPDIANSFVIIQNSLLSSGSNVFKLIVDGKLKGKFGKLFVENSSDSTIVYDSSSFVNFIQPFVDWDFSNNSQKFTFDQVSLRFATICADSFLVQYSVNGQVWINFYSDVASSSINSYFFSFPCFNIFDIYKPVLEGNIFIRIILKKQNISTDTSQVFQITLIPKDSPFDITKHSGLCCFYTLNWDWSALSISNCDSLAILISPSKGSQFNLLHTLPFFVISNYQINNQFNFTDSVIVRLCCTNGCYSSEINYLFETPKIINTVAPNPFNPLVETVEISYTVQKSTSVTIRIFDQGNFLVKEIISNVDRQPNTYYCEYWDGRRQDGSIVASGLYYIVLETSDGKKEIMPIFVK